MAGSTKFSVILTKLADADRDRIIDQLIARKPELGRKWLDAYEYTEKKLAENPYLYPEYWLFIRRAPFRALPYMIYYAINEVDDVVSVTAILHQKQDPKTILDRLNIEF